MSIWIVCEGTVDGYRSTTYELLSQARKLKADGGEEVVALVVGDDAANKDRLNGLADRILVLAGPNLSPYETDPWVDAIASAVGKPSLDWSSSARVSAPGTLLPRIAARLALAAVTSAVGLKLENGVFTLNRPVQGGKPTRRCNSGKGRLWWRSGRTVSWPTPRRGWPPPSRRRPSRRERAALRSWTAWSRPGAGWTSPRLR